MWQGDSVHLNAMISSNYEDIGVGYAEANGNAWYILMAGWVADGAPAAAASQAATQAPAVVPAAPVTLSEPGPDGAIYHEVQSGQAAWTIAARYGLTLEELFALNSLTENSVIHPGDQLLVRAANTPTPTETMRPSATTPAPTETPAPTFTAAAPLEVAAVTTPMATVATDETNDVSQAPSPGLPIMPAALLIAAGLALLLLVYFTAQARRR
jgi:LysM repeat protein